MTVRRFRAFYFAYPKFPSDGAGKNTHNVVEDPGWNNDWDDLMPQDAKALSDELSACSGNLTKDTMPTWTPTPNGQEDLPINCVTWYEAEAFCVWDGGRLPTEAEWTYAAAGGSEGRVLPWSRPADASEIDGSDAVFSEEGAATPGPDFVGLRAGGEGRWFQQDLFGNVAEWTWDDVTPCYTSPCVDCGSTDGSDQKRYRGGSFVQTPQALIANTRGTRNAMLRDTTIGFRCARNVN